MLCVLRCRRTVAPDTYLISTDAEKRSASVSVCCSFAHREQFLLNLKRNIVCVPVIEFISVMPVHSSISLLCLS